MTWMAKCRGESCEIRERCYRWTAPVSEMQSWIEPDAKGTECPKYEPIGVEEGDGA